MRDDLIDGRIESGLAMSGLPTVNLWSIPSATMTTTITSRERHRSGKTVKLTPAGQVFHDYALRMKKLRDESLVAVADHGHTPRGTLSLGANEATCLYVLPAVFAEYCRRFPDVQISIYRNFTYKIVEKLENGSLDVGVLSLPVQSPSLKVQANLQRPADVSFRRPRRGSHRRSASGPPSRGPRRTPSSAASAGAYEAATVKASAAVRTDVAGALCSLRMLSPYDCLDGS